MCCREKVNFVGFERNFLKGEGSWKVSGRDLLFKASSVSNATVCMRGSYFFHWSVFNWL